MKSFLILFLMVSISGSNEQEIQNGEDVLIQLSIELQKLDKNSEYTFRAYANAGKELANRGNYTLADSLFTLGERYEKYELDSSLIMGYKSSRAFMRKVQGRYRESLEEYLEVRSYYINKKDVNQITLIDSYLAEFYRAQGNKAQTEKYLYDALNYTKVHDIDSRSRAYLYSRLASYQSEYLADIDSTIYYANLALDLAIESGWSYVAALSQNELGFIYLNKNARDTTTTFRYYRAAIDNFLNENRIRDYISVLDNMARNYSILNQPAQAVILLEEAIGIAEINNWQTFLDDSYLLMASVQSALGNHQTSKAYYEKAYYTMASTMDDQHAIEVSELTATYEKNIAEQELIEAEVRAEENEKALIISVLITLFSFLIAGLGLFLFLRFRLKNRKLNEQQQIIEETNVELKTALDEKDVLFKELNHRVKNNLTVLSGLVFLQEANETEDGPKQTMATLRNRIQAMAMVHEKLYSITTAKEIAFQDYLEELIPALIQSLSKQSIDVQTDIDCQGLTLPIDEAVPLALIFNEWITNSLKYASQDSKTLSIQITGNKRESGFFVIYADNGPGLDHKKPINPQSMGLKLIDMLVKQLNGEIEQNSSDKGLKFEVTVS